MRRTMDYGKNIDTIITGNMSLIDYANKMLKGVIVKPQYAAA